MTFTYTRSRKSAGALPRGSHKPYRWHPPRSRRGRDLAAMRAAGLNHTTLGYMSLRSLYPQDPNDSCRKPAWAELAYERGWMTFTAYQLTPNERGKNPILSVYTDRPFFGLLKK